MKPADTSKDLLARAKDRGPFTRIGDLIRALDGLSAREADGEQVDTLIDDSIIVSLRLRDSSLNAPEIVWHYLSDFDIRANDPVFAKSQLGALRSQLDKMARFP
ncbi:MAG: hypothetical protein RKE49_15805 [Oceanicaulis sp.]